MYFLNGNRIYIKPGNGCAPLEEQLHDCFAQLEKFNSGKKIFKLNFFADTTSDEAYERLQKKVRSLVSAKFQSPVICGLIAQPPLTCQILVEAFFYDETLWQTSHILENNSAAMLFRRGTAEVLIGNVQAAGNRFCRENAENAFESFENLLKKAGLPVHSVIRQWNYIENILGMEGEKQRYQEFNNVRSEFYASHFNQTGFPAATGIGMNRGGVIIEFVAVNSTDAVSLPLDNPVQTAAHGYSQNVLVGNETSQKSTPKFERARYLEIFGKKMVFISGTASIRGEKTLGQDNPAEQTRITIENIRQLYSPEVLSKINTGPLRPRYGHARVYVKNRKDFVTIKKTFQRFFGKLPVVYIVADICREDLLVEIEGKVIME